MMKNDIKSAVIKGEVIIEGESKQSGYLLDMSDELYAYHRTRVLERVHKTLQTNQQRYDNA